MKTKGIIRYLWKRLKRIKNEKKTLLKIIDKKNKKIEEIKRKEETFNKYIKAMKKDLLIISSEYNALIEKLQNYQPKSIFLKPKKIDSYGTPSYFRVVRPLKKHFMFNPSIGPVNTYTEQADQMETVIIKFYPDFIQQAYHVMVKFDGPFKTDIYYSFSFSSFDDATQKGREGIYQQIKDQLGSYFENRTVPEIEKFLEERRR